MTREEAIEAVKEAYGNSEYTDEIIKALEQEPTTKNDLGVDCISREQALVAIRNLYPSMPRVDFNGSLRKWVDKYKPYIECDDAIKQLPSVTPQEPKIGHWKAFIHNAYHGTDEDGEPIWREVTVYHCSQCNRRTVIKEKYCPNCGAKMESEG